MVCAGARCAEAVRCAEAGGREEEEEEEEGGGGGRRKEEGEMQAEKQKIHAMMRV